MKSQSSLEKLKLACLCLRGSKVRFVFGDKLVSVPQLFFTLASFLMWEENKSPCVAHFGLLGEDQELWDFPGSGAAASSSQICLPRHLGAQGRGSGRADGGAGGWAPVLCGSGDWWLPRLAGRPCDFWEGKPQLRAFPHNVITLSFLYFWSLSCDLILYHQTHDHFLSIPWKLGCLIFF